MGKINDLENKALMILVTPVVLSLIGKKRTPERDCLWRDLRSYSEALTAVAFGSFPNNSLKKVLYGYKHLFEDQFDYVNDLDPEEVKYILGRIREERILVDKVRKRGYVLGNNDSEMEH